VEIWFSILAGQSLKGASFTAVPQLRQHISAFIKRYNEAAKRFCWQKTTVSQKGLTGMSHGFNYHLSLSYAFSETAALTTALRKLGSTKSIRLSIATAPHRVFHPEFAR
jgi:hypothetical protein